MAELKLLTAAAGQQNPKELPSLATVQKLVLKLKATRLGGVSLQKMAITLSEGFKILPIVETDLSEETKILRVRINPNEQDFASERDLSFRSDVNNIHTFGRASVPLESVFYGTVVTSSLTDALNVVLWETSEIFAAVGKTTPTDFDFTLSYWTVKEPIRIAQIVFCKKYVDTIPFVRVARERYIERFKKTLQPHEVDALCLLLEFYSDEFAKTDIRCNDDYLISATYATMLFQSSGIEAVMYPSAKVDNRGINVAVLPFVTERKLRFDGAARMKAAVCGKKRTCYTLRHTEDCGELNSNFTWKDFVNRPETLQKMNDWVTSI